MPIFKHLLGTATLSVAASAMGQTAEDIPLPPAQDWSKTVVALQTAGPEPRFVFAGLVAHSYGSPRSSPYLYYTDRPDAQGIARVTALYSPYRGLCQRAGENTPPPRDSYGFSLRVLTAFNSLKVLGTAATSPIVQVLPALSGIRLDTSGPGFDCPGSAHPPVTADMLEADLKQAERTTWLLRARHERKAGNSLRLDEQ